MKIHPINNNKDHAKAMRRIEQLWGAKKGTSDADELDVLITLVDVYENNSKDHQIGPPDPVQAILFRMDQMGIKQTTLATAIGSHSHLSEVLNYKRPLSISMIERLRRELGISADILIPNKAA